MNNKFAYANDEDRCYGLTGMVISLGVLDSPSALARVSLDDENGDYITFAPDFFFSSSPRYSAKLAWNEMIKQYQLLSAMVIGNVFCRYYYRSGIGVDRDTRKALRALIDDEGHDICQLDDDEIDALFDKTYNYLDRVYRSQQIASIARHLVQQLQTHRILTASDVADEFRN